MENIVGGIGVADELAENLNKKRYCEYKGGVWTRGTWFNGYREECIYRDEL